MSESQRREFTQGMNHSTAGYELVLSPLIMGFLGYLLGRLLDSWFGTAPVIAFVSTILWAVAALAWAVYKVTSGYNAEMARHEANGPWAKRP